MVRLVEAMRMHDYNFLESIERYLVLEMIFNLLRENETETKTILSQIKRPQIFSGWKISHSYYAFPKSSWEIIADVVVEI